MAWNTASYTGTHQEKKEAARHGRANATRDAVAAELAADTPHAKRRGAYKPFGLKLHYTVRLFRPCFHCVWYKREADRDQAHRKFQDEMFLGERRYTLIELVER